ncbi:glutamine amidotransferase [Nocardioides sp.]|uniref:glutamine amidotransferase n=1 Tax=Nocardioides sp. TaxID=35761 RepID=UPI00351661D6
MTRFLLLSIRDGEEVVRDEHEAFARHLGVPVAAVERHQLGVDPVSPSLLADVAARRWDGLVLGGGSFTWSDPAEAKSPVQQAAEADLAHLLDVVVPGGVPFLGVCYGVGTVGSWAGGVVDTTHGEPVGATWVELTDAGRADPLFAAMPDRFAAYGAHKEALSTPPPDAVVLATGPTCPVQAFRLGAHAYVTQFHPELDLAGLTVRVRAYAHHGYFDPADADALLTEAARTPVTAAGGVLDAFARRYARV